MRENPVLQESGTSFIVIFSDLDGTLLDPDTYEWGPAEPALDLCRSREVPVVLVSSKTRAEMEPLRHEMSNSAPFITENGGGIFFPSTIKEDLPPGTTPVAGPEGLRKLSLGVPYRRLVERLQEIREELGLNLRGFSDMKVDEIFRLTGLDPDAACLAAMREYDEPFVILDERPSDRAALKKAAEQRGLAIVDGGRFCHLLSESDKGISMERVISWYEESHGQVTSIALGDSPNDFSMLERADYPVLIRSRRDFPMLKEAIPRLRVTREMGPQGWNSAVLDILTTEFRC